MDISIAIAHASETLKEGVLFRTGEESMMLL